MANNSVVIKLKVQCFYNRSHCRVSVSLWHACDQGEQHLTRRAMSGAVLLGVPISYLFQGKIASLLYIAVYHEVLPRIWQGVPFCEDWYSCLQEPHTLVQLQTPSRRRIRVLIL